MVGVVLVGGAGAAYVVMNSNSSTTNNDQRRVTERNNQPEMGGNSFSTTPATIDDLQVGEEIIVMGSSNTDGSMTAQTILIGSATFELGQFGGMEAGGQATGEFANRQPPEGSNMQEFQNLTPEERQARFAEGGSGAFPEGGFGGGGRGARPGGGGFSGGTRVAGEILDIDDSTITIALTDGGSRLVLYSSQTIISKIFDSETLPVD